MQKHDLIIPEDVGIGFLPDNKERYDSLELTVDELIQGAISNVEMVYSLISEKNDICLAYRYMGMSVDVLIDQFIEDDSKFSQILENLNHHNGPYKHPASVQIMGMLCAGSINRRYHKKAQGRFIINPYSIGVAGGLHDIGKIYIKDDILDSPDELTPYEIIDIKEHPRKAYDMLEGIGDIDVRNMILYHHFQNGRGYPEKLNPNFAGFGEHILGIIDIYDALRSGKECGRNYKKAMNMAEAFSEMTSMTKKKLINPGYYDEFLYFFRDNTDEGRELLSGPAPLRLIN